MLKFVVLRTTYQWEADLHTVVFLHEVSHKYIESGSWNLNFRKELYSTLKLGFWLNDMYSIHDGFLRALSPIAMHCSALPALVETWVAGVT